MNVDVSTSTAINRSRGLVSRYSANPDNAPDCYINIKAVDWKTAPPVTVGSHIASSPTLLGDTYKVVVDLVPGERLGMRTAEGPFPMETSYRWETTSDGSTRIRLRYRGTPAHTWDVLGALQAGYVAAFIARPGRVLYPLGPNPDIIAPDFRALAEQILTGDSAR